MISTLATPVGTLWVETTDHGLTQVSYGPLADSSASTTVAQQHMSATLTQLEAYFAGTIREFSVVLAPQGATAFQERVWDKLEDIDFGATRSYAQLASSLGFAKGGFQAVAGALATNPIMIVVGCHRVVGSDGSLTGYRGGLDVKRKLLDWEKHVANV